MKDGRRWSHVRKEGQVIHSLLYSASGEYLGQAALHNDGTWWWDTSDAGRSGLTRRQALTELRERTA